MKRTHSDHEARFNPQAKKCFKGALESFFTNECPQLGGERTRRVLVDYISKMVTDFFPETTHMKPGQVRWVTVHKDEIPSYGKTTEKTRLTTVTLDLIAEQDAKQRADRKTIREVKKEAVARLCQQAFEARRLPHKR